MTETTDQSFLQKRGIHVSFQRYGIDALSAMALGLFSSLLIGTIFNTLGGLMQQSNIQEFFLDIGSFAVAMTGPAIAIAIGYGLKAPPLVLFSLTGVGYAAYELGGVGAPLAVYFIALLTTEISKLVAGRTKIDIILTPAVTLLLGVLIARVLAPAIGTGAMYLGNSLNWAVDQQPLVMGILVSVIVGILLTLPISSAAICASLGIVGLAGGAAFAGCCAQMIGFAVISYQENKLGGLVAQGIGTSMIQMPNILKNPKILLPPTLASAITGPMATMLFHLEMNGEPIASGMGTSGFVGPIGVITGWFRPSEHAKVLGAVVQIPSMWDWIGLMLISFILPALFSYGFFVLFQKIGWISSEDYALNL